MFYQGKICIIHPLFKIEFWLKEQEIIFKQNAAKMKKKYICAFHKIKYFRDFFLLLGSWLFKGPVNSDFSEIRLQSTMDELGTLDIDLAVWAFAWSIWCLTYLEAC